MTIQFSLFSQEDRKFISALIDGELLTASSEHPNWKAIYDGVLNGDENIASLFDVSKAVSDKFARVSERVTLVGGTVHLDGDPIDDELSNQIVRFLDGDEEDWKPLVNFLEKISQNPEPHSREQAYRWLNRYNFPITEDGDIVAYKGVRKGSEGEFLSINSGKARVDGEVVTGAIPNHVGAVVEMPRSEVQHDPQRGCHTGLHAGTWDYASGFARGAVLTVRINPRDIVSVPTDCADQKVRVCRYVVTGVTEQAYEGLVWYDDEDDEDDLYDDEDYGWGDGDDDEDDYAFAPVPAVNTTTATTVQVKSNRPTAQNFLKQKRGPDGKFLPKA